MPDTVSLIDPATGDAKAVPVDEVDYRLARGWSRETAEGRTQRLSSEVKEDVYGGAAGTVLAGAAGLARGFTGGLSDAGLAALGAGRDLAALREVNPITSTITEIGGTIAPTGIGGIAARAGTKIAGRGGGALAQIGRAATASAVEGAIVGAGQGVSELALSSDPLTLERAASVIGSNALFGGATGGAIGGAGKAVERGLVRAKAALDDVATRGLGTAGVSDDLAKMDAKGLRAAQKSEIEAIEAARVPQRAQVADELKAFRKELKEQKVWLAAKGVEDAEVKASAIGKRTLKADKALDNLLDDPKALAENPRAALSSLRKQEAALDDLVNKHGAKLRESFAADTSGARAKALDNAAVALEKNRSLQAKIADLSAKPASSRLDEIGGALENLSAPKPSGSVAGMAGDMLSGSIFGHVAGAFSGLPVIGPMIGAKAAGLASRLVGGKLGAASKEAAERGSKAIGAFLDVGRKIPASAPVLATKVLSNVVYAPSRQKPVKDAKPEKATLAKAYKARADEIRSQIEPAPDGTLQMRPSARAQAAEKLRPIALVNPLLADHMETVAARRLEFLASKLPKRPDVAGIQTGPDKWQPSDMEMRGFARYAAAVEDPHGVVERLASGSVTPEDAEAMRSVYPEMYADIQRQIIEALPTLRTTLPYQRRLAMSIFSGVPVDPVLDPRVLSVLQASFAAEEGTEGGVQAPRAQPAFGSVSKEPLTPAQERAT